jgi:hypothetical protein
MNEDKLLIYLLCILSKSFRKHTCLSIKVDGEQQNPHLDNL